MSNPGSASPKKSNKTLKLVRAALFAAIALALKPLSVYLLPVARLSIFPVPVLISGIVLGPVWGAAVGVVTDVVGYLFFDTTGAALNPLLTIEFAVIGAVPGLIFMLFKKEGKASNCNVYNVFAYLGLLVVLVGLFVAKGALKFEEGALNILSPASGNWKALSWWAVGGIAAAFLLYSVVIVMLVTKRGIGSSDKNTTSMILFATTIAVLTGSILIGGTALALMYGWSLALTYCIKIFQSFLTIPLYSLLIILVYPVLEKQKNKL
ncbi:MAG: folate family ECF transporter S component [Eubacteriaceae bacterium]|nr:folate family ECF transporter S component [Eubacteriaceae bacterium]